MRKIPFFVVISSVAGGAPAEEPPVKPAPLMTVLEEELDYARWNAQDLRGQTLYFLSYAVYDVYQATLKATLGTVNSTSDRRRALYLDVRVGDYQRDDTHLIKEIAEGRMLGSGDLEFPLNDDPLALRQALWLATDNVFTRNAKRYENVLEKQREEEQGVEERQHESAKGEEKEDDHDRVDPDLPDFTRERPQIAYERPAPTDFDAREWAGRLKRVSALARDYPLVYQSEITFEVDQTTRYMVSSEGTRLQTPRTFYQIDLRAATVAPDRTTCQQQARFGAATLDALPDEAALTRTFRELLERVLAQREAPMAETYTGPAIFRNRAAAILFHRAVGQRLEGDHPLQGPEEAKYVDLIGQRILPEEISLFDDPTLKTFAGVDLRGHYLHDDHGVAAQRVALVEDGVLKTLLASRRPLRGVDQSNGHGRRGPNGYPSSRQGVLVASFEKTVPFEQLRAMLVDLCKRENKPYGLFFDDVSEDYPGSRLARSTLYQVLPRRVYRVHADGRPDELIHGVDIAGLAIGLLKSLEGFVAAGDDPAAFNGIHGGPSGLVPVSAISPSILLSKIEITPRHVDQASLPILDPPPLKNKMTSNNP